MDTLHILSGVKNGDKRSAAAVVAMITNLSLTFDPLLTTI